jgi:hypothetical protein
MAANGNAYGFWAQQASGSLRGKPVVKLTTLWSSSVTLITKELYARAKVSREEAAGRLPGWNVCRWNGVREPDTIATVSFRLIECRVNFVNNLFDRPKTAILGREHS